MKVHLQNIAIRTILYVIELILHVMLFCKCCTYVSSNCWSESGIIYIMFVLQYYVIVHTCITSLENIWTCIIIHWIRLRID